MAMLAIDDNVRVACDYSLVRIPMSEHKFLRSHQMNILTNFVQITVHTFLSCHFTHPSYIAATVESQLFSSSHSRYHSW